MACATTRRTSATFLGIPFNTRSSLVAKAGQASSLALVTVLMTALVSVATAGQAVAQSGQATPAPAAITTEQFGRIEPADAPGKALYPLRVTFAPGATAGAHTHPGTTIYHLDSGTLVFTLVGGQATLVPAAASAATPAAGEEITSGMPVTLKPGDTVLYDGSAVQTEENPSSGPAVILISNLRGTDEPARMPAAATPVP